MPELIAVDWGTSSLRAARIAPDGSVREERASARGILTVPAGGFPAVLADACGDWLAGDALCLVGGMAGSRQGWQEAPYCPCPAGFEEVAAALTWITPGRIALVPGLHCRRDGVPDVMRGEEVQVLGALSLLERGDGVFVLPGTHSKWVDVAGGRVRGFATFMTGEIYGLLRQHSILARTLPPEDGPLDESAFLRGVRHACAATSLLHTAFSTRTLALCDEMPAAALPSYLSGLLIGDELRAQPELPRKLTLVGSPALTARYALALASIGVGAEVRGAGATWRGLGARAGQLGMR